MAGSGGSEMADMRSPVHLRCRVPRRRTCCPAGSAPRGRPGECAAAPVQGPNPRRQFQMQIGVKGFARQHARWQRMRPAVRGLSIWATPALRGAQLQSCTAQTRCRLLSGARQTPWQLCTGGTNMSRGRLKREQAHEIDEDAWYKGFVQGQFQDGKQAAPDVRWPLAGVGKDDAVSADTAALHRCNLCLGGTVEAGARSRQHLQQRHVPIAPVVKGIQVVGKMTGGQAGGGSDTARQTIFTYAYKSPAT